MEIIKCACCEKELTKETSYETAWEHLNDFELLCSSCYDVSSCDVSAYLDDMYYACLNGCCACCGCSCM